MMSWAVTDSVGTQLWIDRTCRVNLNYSGEPLFLAFCFGLYLFIGLFKRSSLQYVELHLNLEFQNIDVYFLRLHPFQDQKQFSFRKFSQLPRYQLWPAFQPNINPQPSFSRRLKIKVLQTNSKLFQTLCATPSPTLITLTQMTPCRNRWLDVFPFQQQWQRIRCLNMNSQSTCFCR